MELVEDHYPSLLMEDFRLLKVLNELMMALVMEEMTMLKEKDRDFHLNSSLLMLNDSFCNYSNY